MTQIVIWAVLGGVPIVLVRAVSEFGVHGGEHLLGRGRGAGAHEVGRVGVIREREGVLEL